MTNTTTTSTSALEIANDLMSLMSKVRQEQNLLPALDGIKRKLPAEEEEEEEEVRKRAKLSPVDVNRIYDRNEFLDRLKTYPGIYIYSRRPVSAIECAKNGWCYEKTVESQDNYVGMLSCNDCKGTLAVIDLSPHDPSHPQVSRITAIYEEGLKAYHEEGCFWRLSRCNDYVNSFPITTYKEALEILCTQGKLLYSQRDILPAIVDPLDKYQRRAVNQVAQHYEYNKDEPMTGAADPALITAYTFPLYGWKLKSTSVPYIQCDSCFQRHSLSQETKADPFDVIKEHRPNCPWVSSTDSLIYRPGSSEGLMNGYTWMLGFVNKEHLLLLEALESDRTALQRLSDKKAALRKKLEEDTKQILLAASKPFTPSPA
ncbi:C3HC zinc finger-like-domain-containing protein [Phycomyces nitens]|nr:C3HC zinc finger-like-domain-containing protein [Phycomyces nitens]